MMKAIQKIIYVGMIIFLVICFTGCGKSVDADSGKVEKQTEVQEKDEDSDEDSEEIDKEITEEENSEESIDEDSDVEYSFEVSNETVEEGDISLEYPQLINSNIPGVDEINASIYSNVLQMIEEETKNINPEYPSTMSLMNAANQYNNVLLSIGYIGSTYVEEFDVKTSFFAGHNILLGTGDSITLSDLFSVDQNFMDIVKLGMYTPYNKEVNLEAAGVDVFGVVAETYSDEDLINLFNDDYTDFILTEFGFFVSIPVPDEFGNPSGDHIDLAINYEWLESSMLDNSPVWENYMSLDESGDTGVSEAGFVWSEYYNETYGMGLPYPDIFDMVEENEAGDGVWMESSEGKYSLYIWAEWNANGSTGDSLLKEAREFTQILEEYSDEESYWLSSTGEDTEGITHLGIECCVVDPTVIVRYRLDYLEEEADNFIDVNEVMANGLQIYNQ